MLYFPVKHRNRQETFPIMKPERVIYFKHTSIKRNPIGVVDFSLRHRKRLAIGREVLPL